MRISIGSLLVILSILVSCEKDHPGDKSYLEYLKDKSILNIVLHDGVKYVLTARTCDTCYVPPYHSYIPSIIELTIVKGLTYRNYFGALITASISPDHEGNIYFLQGNKLYNIDHNGQYEEVLNTGEHQFYRLTFDADNNIWFSGSDAIAFWDKSTFTVYTHENSILPELGANGITIDDSGIIWVSTYYPGLISIDNGNWQMIPYSSVPGLGPYSGLTNPVYADNSLWFKICDPNTESSVVKFHEDTWTLVYPDTSRYCELVMDQQGTMWAFSHYYGFNDSGASILLYAKLKYYHNGDWTSVDVSGIKSKILTVNADAEKVYVCTLQGLNEILK